MPGKPEGLKAGDVLLYKAAGQGWLSNAIGWFEASRPEGAAQYSHVALVFDAEQACEMNPPHARIMPLGGEDWSRIDVFRMDVKGISPFDNETVLNAFHDSVRAHIGPDCSYNYQRIGRFAVVSLLARVGMGGAARWMLKANYPESHYEVCSTWAEDRLTDALRAIQPDFDLFADLGENQAMPSDYPRSPWLKPVKGV